MTDARLPDRWLTDVKYLDLSDSAWRLFTSALMWSNQQGTDGDIPRVALNIFRTEEQVSSAVAELVQKSHWEETASGFRFSQQWERELGQSTMAEVESRKEANRQRQRRLREKGDSSSGELDLASSRERNSPARRNPDVVRDVTRDVTRDVGQETTGKDRNAWAPSIAAKCRHCGLPTGGWNIGGTAVASCEACLGTREPM